MPVIIILVPVLLLLWPVIVTMMVMRFWWNAAMSLSDYLDILDARDAAVDASIELELQPA